VLNLQGAPSPALTGRVHLLKDISVVKVHATRTHIGIPRAATRKKSICDKRAMMAAGNDSFCALRGRPGQVDACQDGARSPCFIGTKALAVRPRNRLFGSATVLSLRTVSSQPPSSPDSPAGASSSCSLELRQSNVSRFSRRLSDLFTFFLCSSGMLVQRSFILLAWRRTDAHALHLTVTPGKGDRGSR